MGAYPFAPEDHDMIRRTFFGALALLPFASAAKAKPKQDHLVYRWLPAEWAWEHIRFEDMRAGEYVLLVAPDASKPPVLTLVETYPLQGDPEQMGGRWSFPHCYPRGHGVETDSSYHI